MRTIDGTDLIIDGAGLAGLVAAAEAADAGRTVLLLDQEGEQSLGGQAFWSFGGLFFVNSPEQRRLGIRDSRELAMNDWMATAGFDRAEDHWPRVAGRAVVGRFDGGALTSDGGAVLLREVERATGILAQFAGCFHDHRDPTRVRHSVATLVRQRIHALAWATRI